MADNELLTTILQMLLQEAGPRGATFAGRVAQPGESAQQIVNRPAQDLSSVEDFAGPLLGLMLAGYLSKRGIPGRAGGGMISTDPTSMFYNVPESAIGKQAAVRASQQAARYRTPTPPLRQGSEETLRSRQVIGSSASRAKTLETSGSGLVDQIIYDLMTNRGISKYNLSDIMRSQQPGPGGKLYGSAYGLPEDLPILTPELTKMLDEMIYGALK